MKSIVDTADAVKIKSLVPSGRLDGNTNGPGLVAGSGRGFTGLEALIA